MSEFAMKKKLNAEIAAAKKAGKSVQTVGKLQYKLNQLMKTPQKGTPVKRKTPLTGSPSAGTAKKKAGPDMYKQAVALDKPKGKGTGIIKSTAKTTPYPTANITKMPTSQAVTRKQARGSRVDVNKGGSVVRKRNKKY
tara:strand:+ start:1171 stop:1584 length:414 start_codon:yes stop_codon:yes gene_type:complete